MREPGIRGTLDGMTNFGREFRVRLDSSSRKDLSRRANWSGTSSRQCEGRDRQSVEAVDGRQELQEAAEDMQETRGRYVGPSKAVGRSKDAGDSGQEGEEEEDNQSMGAHSCWRGLDADGERKKMGGAIASGGHHEVQRVGQRQSDQKKWNIAAFAGQAGSDQGVGDDFCQGARCAGKVAGTKDGGSSSEVTVEMFRQQSWHGMRIIARLQGHGKGEHVGFYSHVGRCGAGRTDLLTCWMLGAGSDGQKAQRRKRDCLVGSGSGRLRLWHQEC